MAKLAIKPGSTSVSLLVKINDLSAADNSGKTGLAFGDMTAYYARPGEASVPITLKTQTVNGNFDSGGFIQVDATNMPGIYRLDIPDGVCATGKRSAVVTLKATGDSQQCDIEIDLANEADVVAWKGTAPATTDTAGYPVVTIKDGTAAGELDLTSGKVALTDGSIVAATFASDAITAAKLASDVGTEIATAVAAAVVESEGSVTLGNALKYILAVLTGVTTVSGATYTVKTHNGNATRVTFTLNASKERTAASLNP